MAKKGEQKGAERSIDKSEVRERERRDFVQVRQVWLVEGMGMEKRKKRLIFGLFYKKRIPCMLCYVIPLMFRCDLLCCDMVFVRCWCVVLVGVGSGIFSGKFVRLLAPSPSCKCCCALDKPRRESLHYCKRGFRSTFADRYRAKSAEFVDARSINL